jgi:hypothetical protein
MFDTTNIGSTRVTRGAHADVSPTPAELRKAGSLFSQRRDQFAAGKDEVCFDLAAKLERFGSYVSPKQQEFAAKLVAWSKPRPASADWGRPVPKLFAVMQKHSVLHVDPLKLSRRNQDSLVWIMYADVCVGKIENERASVFARKADAAGTTQFKVLDLLAEFEEDPLAAAKKYGKLSGRCCSCGRDLTDPASIEAGIGPICAQRFGGF